MWRKRKSPFASSLEGGKKETFFFFFVMLHGFWDLEILRLRIELRLWQESLGRKEFPDHFEMLECSLNRATLRQ